MGIHRTWHEEYTRYGWNGSISSLISSEETTLSTKGSRTHSFRHCLSAVENAHLQRVENMLNMIQRDNNSSKWWRTFGSEEEKSVLEYKVLTLTPGLGGFQCNQAAHHVAWPLKDSALTSHAWQAGNSAVGQRPAANFGEGTACLLRLCIAFLFDRLVKTVLYIIYWWVEDIHHIPLASMTRSVEQEASWCHNEHSTGHSTVWCFWVMGYVKHQWTAERVHCCISQAIKISQLDVILDRISEQWIRFFASLQMVIG